VKPAVVRFYIDQDILGLKFLASLRPDITYPGDPGAVVHKRERSACPVMPGTRDVDWLPIVAEQGWLIITRDAQIQQHRAEINAVVEHGAKMVALASDDARDRWGQFEVVMNQWRRLEELANETGPFVYAAHRTSLRRLAPEVRRARRTPPRRASRRTRPTRRAV
jgi:PIN like domain